MKRESAKQSAEERQRRAATRRKIFLKAKGWMLIRTIPDYGYYKAPPVPSSGEALTRKDTPFGRCSLYRIDGISSRTYANRSPTRTVARSSSSSTRLGLS